MSALTLLQSLIAALRSTLSRHGNYLKLVKKITALVLSHTLIFAPTYAYGGVLQLLHFEWAYDTTLPDLAGYRIYHDTNLVVDVNDPTALTLTLDQDVLLETGAVNTFTMTAYDAFGNESSQSTPYTIEVPAEDANGNIPPVPVIQASVTAGEAPLTVDFDGNASYDFGGGIIVDHSWDFGDGDTASGGLASHSYINAGNYTVWLVVTDDAGAASSEQVTITVTLPAGLNNPPTAAITASPTTGEAPLSVNFNASGSNDTDGSITLYSWDFGDGNSSAGQTGSHNYISAGTYTATLTVTDDDGATDTAQTTITVTEPAPQNNPPTAAISANPLSGNAPLTVNFSGAGSSDSDGSIISHEWDFGDGDTGTGGAVSHQFITGGTYTVLLTVTDDGGLSDQQQVNIAVNNAPAATGTSITTTEDSTFSGTLTASDSDGNPLAYSIVANGTRGTAVISNNMTGAFTYTPNADENGSDSFTFKVNDGLADSNIATVSVTINGVNDLPIATGGSITTTEDVAVSGTLSAADTEGSPLSYSIVANGAKGTAIIINASTGAFTYTPNSNATGADSFSFKANDGMADSNTATISVAITAVNDNPVAADDIASTNEDIPATITVLANDTDADGDALMVAAVTQGTNGTVTTNGATVGYTPNAGWSGADSFTYTISDGNGGTDSAAVSMTVIRGNDPPAANADTLTTNEDSSATINVLANDTDPDGDPLTVSSVTQGTNGNVTTNGITVTYTPNTDWNGADSFTYTVIDGNGGTDTASVSVTVNGVNDVPAAVNANLSVNEDSTASGLLIASDADGDSLTYSLVANGAKGTAVITNAATGAFSYTPDANATGADSFTFKVNDGTADSNSATVSITINGVNDRPTASDSSITTAEDTPAGDFLTATDIEGDVLTYSIVANGSLGTAIITNPATGAFTYTPDANATGADSFTFKANDGNDDSNTATVSVTISAVNDAPVAMDDTASANEDTAATITVLANDTDAEGDSLTVSAVSQGSNGSVTTNGTTVTYTPNPDWNGSDSFTYTISDGNGGTDTATVSMMVIAGNDIPTASDDSANTDEDTAIIVNVLANDTDLDGDSLSVSAVTQGGNGSVTTNGTTVAYTPNPDWNGSDSFTYTVSDGNGGTDSAAVNVTVSAANDAPIANNASISVTEDSAATSSLSANDPEGDPLTYSIVMNGTQGSAVITNASTGAFTYTPNPNAAGSDSFTFKANDGTDDSNTATITVTITPVNDIPAAADDSAATDEDTPVTITVLANDTDVDGDTLSISAITQGSNGSVTTSGTTVTYTPNADWNGTDSFTYTVSDGNGGSDSAAVVVTINATNDAPVAVNSTVAATEDTAAAGALSAADVEGDSLTYSIVTNGSLGTATITNTATGAFTYTPNPDATGTDSFTFKANDGTDGSNTATITVTITPVNDIPVAADDSAAADEDTPVTITVLANDTDVDGDTLSISAITQGVNGSVTFSGTTVTYTPKANWSGPDTFIYTVSDGNGGTDTATVHLTVTMVNDAPVAGNANITIAEDGSVSSTLTATDIEGDALTYAVVSNGTKGTAVVTNAATGAFSYTPNPNATGTDSFTFKANDGKNDSNIATVAVTITAVNDIPVTTNDTASTNEDTAVTISVLANDTDVDGDTLLISAVTQGSNGSVTTSGITVTYTPNPGWSGSDSFTYTISDGNGGTDTATVNMAVNAVPLSTNASITVLEDTAITGSLSASDQDDLNLTYSIESNGTLGTATITDSTSGKFTYTPKANLDGTDSFSFRVSDGKAHSNTATVTVTLLPVNDPPAAGDDFASTEMNLPVAINVLENDADIDDEILRVTSVTPGSNGSVGFDDQKVIYTPGENFSGTDILAYTVEDQKGAKTTARVTVEVQAGSTSAPGTGRTDRKKERNYPPVASNSSVSVNEDTSLQGQVIATDPEGSNLTYSVEIAPAHGTVTLNSANGSYVYTPAANYAGQDRFTFSASDGKFKSKPGTIYLLVKPVNDAPTATPDSVIIDSGTMVSINVLANDFDPDNDPLVITSVTQGSHGRTSLSVNKIIYIPEAGYSGQDEFTYVVSDYNRGTATGKVTVTLLPLNDKPLALSSTFTVPQNLPANITLSATDPENDPLTYTIVKQPTQGGLTATDPPGTYLYEPKPAATGSDSIVFTVSDGNSTSNEATATITIANLPAANAGGPYFGFVGAPVTFNADGSTSPDSQIVQYEWDFNDDGVFDDKVTFPATVIEHVWTTPYTGNVALRVTDNLGITNTAGASLIVTVLGDQDGDNDFDKDDVTLFEKNYPIAQGNCLGDRNYLRVMDLNNNGCITQDDQAFFMSLVP